MSINRATILGEVGQEPKRVELKQGRYLVKFTVMTTEKGKDKDFNSWHQVSVWNEALCELAQKCLRKGSKVFAEGKISTRAVEKDGKSTYYTEIQVGPYGGTLVPLDPPPSTSSPASRAAAAELDDEIPY